MISKTAQRTLKRTLSGFVCKQKEPPQVRQLVENAVRAGLTWCRRYGRRHRPDRERCSRFR